MRKWNIDASALSYSSPNAWFSPARKIYAPAASCALPEHLLRAIMPAQASLGALQNKPSQLLILPTKYY